MGYYVLRTGTFAAGGRIIGGFEDRDLVLALLKLLPPHTVYSIRFRGVAS